MAKIFNEDKHFDLSKCLIKKQAFFDNIDFSETYPEKIKDILTSGIEDVEFYQCIFKDLNLENSSFNDKISFFECLFKGNTKFSDSSFANKVSFQGSTFDGIAELNNIEFSEGVSFEKIHTRPARGYFYFRGDKKEPHSGYYKNEMSFNGAVFESEVSFFGQRFSDTVKFSDITFMNKFWFTNANLGMKSSFRRLNFRCDGIKDIDDCFRIFRERLESSYHKLEAEKILDIERRLYNKSEDSKNILPSKAENKPKQHNSNLLTTEEAAEYLQIKPNTLEVWRSQDPGKVPFVKVGRNVRYRLEDLQAFISKK